MSEEEKTAELKIPSKRPRILRQLAYQGRPDCQNPGCRRMGITIPDEHGHYSIGKCIGWHCPLCDEPCGPQGHECK